ncbi:hypothetical protein ABIB34_003710 [Rhodococcus sp. UYP5]
MFLTIQRERGHGFLWNLRVLLIILGSVRGLMITVVQAMPFIGSSRPNYASPIVGRCFGETYLLIRLVDVLPKLVRGQVARNLYEHSLTGSAGRLCRLQDPRLREGEDRGSFRAAF